MIFRQRATEFKTIDWLPTKNRIDQCFCVNVVRFFKGASPSRSLSVLHTTFRNEFLLHTLLSKLTFTNSGPNSMLIPNPKTSHGLYLLFFQSGGNLLISPRKPISEKSRSCCDFAEENLESSESWEKETATQF